MKENQHEIGTVDCIAYDEARNNLFLVNCTTGPLDVKEIGRYLNVQQYIHEKLFKNTTVRLYSVLFTSTSRTGAIKTASEHNIPLIKIFYQEDISTLLDLIEEGKESAFIDMITTQFS